MKSLHIRNAVIAYPSTSISLSIS